MDKKILNYGIHISNGNLHSKNLAVGSFANIDENIVINDSFPLQEGRKVPEQSRFPTEVYDASLKEIFEISFSSREIAVIAAILLEKPTQQIPDILPIIDEEIEGSVYFRYKISEKTVASHIENIYEKLSPLIEIHKYELKNKITKRDKIKYVVQKSEKRKDLAEYCLWLQIENVFLYQLEKIFRKQSSLKMHNDQERTNLGYCHIYYWKEYPVDNFHFYCHLARYLNDRKSKEETKIISSVFKEICSSKLDDSLIKYIFYIIPDEFRIHLDLKGNETQKIMSAIQHKNSDASQVIFLLDTWKDTKQIPKLIEKGEYIHFSGEQGNYYLSFFEVLRKMFPKLSFDEEIKVFVRSYNSLISQKSDE